MHSITRRSRPEPEAFRIDVHPERTVVRVAPAGELDIATTSSLAVELRELRDVGFDYIVLDLRRLTFIDSTGVALILTEDRIARGSGRDFTLIGGSRAIQRVLEICGVAGLLRFEPINGEPGSATKAKRSSRAPVPAERELAASP